jgi:hypothetical protein
MTERARLGGNGGSFKTDCVGEGVVLQVCEAKSLTMFGASENKLTPDIATAGANAMGGVAGYREPSARLIGLLAGGGQWEAGGGL